MLDSRRILETLIEGRHLSESDAADLLGRLADSTYPPAAAGALLTALRCKGVTADEVRGFAGAMRALARVPAFPSALDAIDIVGTGGDASGSLNLSTGAALLTAACGLTVVKHGNRSISSRSGSADLLEALGLSLPLDEIAAADCLAATGFTFLFAPYFHPAMKSVSPVRAALGIRTVFNLLGPLTNPGRPRFYLIGAFDAAAAELIAKSLAGMDAERAWVVHGAAGWDEPTPVGPFVAFDVRAGSMLRTVVDPRDLGLEPCSPSDLAGGDAASNLEALQDVFELRERGSHRSALCLQSGIALYIAGRAAGVREGIAAAGATLDNGRASAWLERLRRFAAKARRP